MLIIDTWTGHRMSLVYSFTFSFCLCMIDDVLNGRAVALNVREAIHN